MSEPTDWGFYGAAEPGSPLADAYPLGMPGTAWTPGPERYDVRHKRAVPVRMSDGNQLRVDITRPVQRQTGRPPAGPVPVILEQTPYRHVAYDQCPPEAAARFFVSRGYIYALAHVRGSGGSEGTIGFFDDREQRDGEELVRWAAALEGADGSVVLNGDSYAGLNQLFTVAQCGQGHAVRAIAPGYMGPDLLREPFTVGGVPTEVGVSFWTDWLGSVARGQAYDRAARSWVDRLAEDMAHGTGRAFDDAWWATRRAATTVQSVVANNVPALLWTSGGDFYRDSLPRLYAMFQNAFTGRPPWHPMTPGQSITSRYRLSIGPIAETHSSGGQPIQPGGPRDVAALHWFETWLNRRSPDAADEQPTVRFIELHSGAWRGTNTWPPTDHYDHHHLDLGVGRLAHHHSGPPADAMAAEVSGARPLVCAMEPFRDERSYAGPISLTLVVSSDSPDFLVDARLHLLDPEGHPKTLPITGAQLASCRTLDEERSWHDTDGKVIAPVLTMAGADHVPTDTPIQLTVELKSVPFCVFAGEQLVLEIGSGVPGGADAPPQARVSLSEERARELRLATFRVHSSRGQRSFLSLPADMNAT